MFKVHFASDALNHSRLGNLQGQGFSGSTLIFSQCYREAVPF